MKIQFVLHGELGRPGIIEKWVQEKGFDHHVCRPFAGEVLPKASEFDCLILMGGSQSALKIQQFPYLIDEVKLAEQALSLDKKVIGICLGAQILGEAHGAKTEVSPSKEIGVFPILLTNDGEQDALLNGLPNQFSVTHWHNDMPGLTKEAKVLAMSQGCPRQIVRYSESAYGFQCHPEITMNGMQKIIQAFKHEVIPGPFIQSEQELLNNDYCSINKKMIQILDNLTKL